MAAHRIFNYFGRILVAWLAVMALAASEQHGVVKSNGMPVPGATVTATQGDKKFTTTTGDNGEYSFADLPDGVWTIRVEMMGFAKLSREVGVTAEAPSPTWDLKVESLSALNADIAGAKKAGSGHRTAGTRNRGRNGTRRVAPEARDRRDDACGDQPRPLLRRKRRRSPQRPPCEPPSRICKMAGAADFSSLGVNASGDQADAGAGAVDLGGGDVNQSSRMRW